MKLPFEYIQQEESEISVSQFIHQQKCPILYGEQQCHQKVKLS